jgi:hypothetical protein
VCTMKWAEASTRRILFLTLRKEMLIDSAAPFAPTFLSASVPCALASKPSHSIRAT